MDNDNPITKLKLELKNKIQNIILRGRGMHLQQRKKDLYLAELKGIQSAEISFGVTIKEAIEKQAAHTKKRCEEEFADWLELQGFKETYNDPFGKKLKELRGQT